MAKSGEPKNAIFMIWLLEYSCKAVKWFVFHTMPVLKSDIICHHFHSFYAICNIGFGYKTIINQLLILFYDAFCMAHKNVDIC